MKTPTPSRNVPPENKTGAAAPGHTLEIPLRLFPGTIKRVQQAMAGLAPGEVVRVLTNDP